MPGTTPKLLLILCLLPASAVGCALRQKREADRDAAHMESRITQIEYPDVESPTVSGPLETPRPYTLGEAAPEFRDIKLEEAVKTALANSAVVREMGGLLLQSPSAMQTAQVPALAETDPRFGVEAALSAFDAMLAATTSFERNDRRFNNLFSGQGVDEFQQDLHVYNFELRKRTAVGTAFTLRKRFDYDFNNSPFNRDAQPPFPPGTQGPGNLPWGMRLEGEIRQPLLQGAGAEFNRIAGPYGSPGFYNGVLIARVNTDVSLAEFEAAVVQLISDVENSYWELYFAYRDLDAKKAARDRAYETWKQVNVLYKTGPGLELAATAEAQAREQLYRLEAEVQDALLGRTVEKTRSTVFRGTGGVHTSERRLRRTMGLPAADGQLLRPADEPSIARTTFEWSEAVAESLARRVELRRQKWQIKRRELELVAARNFLLPRVDAVGLYRFRGLGHDLIGSGGGDSPLDSALQNLVTGDYQEWSLGLEMTAPIGYRQGHAAVRNAQLQLARESAILAEQEQEVISDLSGAMADMSRAYELAITNFQRRLAALRQLDSLEVLLKEADNVEKPRLLDLQLEAQRRLADAESQYYRALAEHAVAIKNVHLEKGSLLDYNQVYLSEGDWPEKAYFDASRRERLRMDPARIDYAVCDPLIVSQGTQPPEIITAPSEELLPEPAPEPTPPEPPAPAHEG